LNFLLGLNCHLVRNIQEFYSLTYNFNGDPTLKGSHLIEILGYSIKMVCDFVGVSCNKIERNFDIGRISFTHPINTKRLGEFSKKELLEEIVVMDRLLTNIKQKP